MDMIEPTIKMLVEANSRSQRTEARLAALPCQNAEEEIAKQVSIRTIVSKNKATETILDALDAARGAVRHQARRKSDDYAKLQNDHLSRPLGEPPPKHVMDEDGFAAVVEEGGAPLRDQSDPTT